VISVAQKRRAESFKGTSGVRIQHLTALAAATILLSACATTQKQVSQEFKPAPGPYKILLMKPDIEVGLLTAGGLVEPNKDWTDKARTGVFAALEKNNAGRGGAMLRFTEIESTDEQKQLNNDLENLHRAVAQSIARHKYGLENLPTKKDKFDWTLGTPAQQLGTQSTADYALFLYGRDSFSSGGRMAVQMMGMLGCAVGACIVVGGGQQFGYASLVELKSGNVVWFNILGKASGDMRTPEGAQAMVDSLLKTMPLGPQLAAK
jgi:hypothetical protein